LELDKPLLHHLKKLVLVPLQKDEEQQVDWQAGCEAPLRRQDSQGQ
jgi:hypothetical protein